MRKANSEQSNNTKETINYYPFGSEMRMSSPYQIIRKNGGTVPLCHRTGIIKEKSLIRKFLPAK